MTIIISKDSQDAIRISESSVPNENFLQSFIYHNPESIPLYEIDEDIRAFVLAREFPTLSGPIDALAIDGEGNLYIIETKLYQNPDKRRVIAQVLDYGSALWKQGSNFDTFMKTLNAHVQKNFTMDLTDKLSDFFDQTDEEIHGIIDNLKSNIEEGSFKFVILMDTLYDSLKDLLLYINLNSQFHIYAVEYKYYELEQFQIIIPKLYGNYQKKSVNIRTKASSIGKNRFGHRKGTQSARIDELLIQGTRLKEAAEDIGSSVQRVKSHIRHMINIKQVPVIEEKDIFRISPDWLDKNPAVSE